MITNKSLSLLKCADKCRTQTFNFLSASSTKAFRVNIRVCLLSIVCETNINRFPSSNSLGKASLFNRPFIGDCKAQKTKWNIHENLFLSRFIRCGLGFKFPCRNFFNQKGSADNFSVQTCLTKQTKNLFTRNFYLSPLFVVPFQTEPSSESRPTC